jgi:hypothetical protein
MKTDKKNFIPTIDKSFFLNDQKKRVSFKSPDTEKMQEVKIDGKTKLYIALGASADEARSRYLDKMRAKLKY